MEYRYYHHKLPYLQYEYQECSDGTATMSLISKFTHENVFPMQI